MATKKEIVEIINRNNAGQATEQDKAFLENWYMQHKHEDQMEYDADKLLEDTSAIWDNLEKQYQRTRLIALWKKISVAAAAVAAITLGVWLYYTSSMNGRHLEGSTATRDLYANDVAPGKNTATLTLASGEVITLDTNRTGVVIDPSSLKYNDGTSISSSLREGTTKQSQLVTASTPRGGTYQVTLPDGTEVWLNADSKITFPSQFVGAKRQIYLEGEAYFQVAKMTRSSLRGKRSDEAISSSNERVPFIVVSKGQQVEVLGTHFNINAYPDEASTKTTLLEGSVNVNGKILTPNQQAVLTANNTIKVHQVDPETITAWKDGDFNFKEEDLQTAMLKVARWYDIEVIYDASAPKDLELGGWVSRKRNISAVLKMIESTGKVHFKVEGRRILVTK